MRINGNALSQQEAAWPEIGIMQFGTENTGCQRIIRTTIEHIRSGTNTKKLESCSSESDVPSSLILQPCSLELYHMS